MKSPTSVPIEPVASTAPIKEARQMPPTPTLGPEVGRMTVTLHDKGMGPPVANVEFDPVGRFTAALLYNNLSLFIKKLEIEHAHIRHIERHPVAVGGKK